MRNRRNNLHVHRPNPGSLKNIRMDNRQKANDKGTPLPKDVNLQQSFLFFPEGFEKFFLVVYVVILPYLAGVLFLFFYVAKRDTTLFVNLYKSQMYLLTWCIGYEILAAVVLLFIVKSIVFAKKTTQTRHFQRP